jgi:hypothetical protein
VCKHEKAPARAAIILLVKSQYTQQDTVKIVVTAVPFGMCFRVRVHPCLRVGMIPRMGTVRCVHCDSDMVNNRTQSGHGGGSSFSLLGWHSRLLGFKAEPMHYLFRLLYNIGLQFFRLQSCVQELGLGIRAVITVHMDQTFLGCGTSISSPTLPATLLPSKHA